MVQSEADQGQGVVRIYVKGADDVMVPRVECGPSVVDLPLAVKHLDLYSKQGLRTLVCAMKVLSVDDFEKWENRVKSAELNMDIMARDVLLEQLYEEVMTNDYSKRFMMRRF